MRVAMRCLLCCAYDVLGSPAKAAGSRCRQWRPCRATVKGGREVSWDRHCRSAPMTVPSTMPSNSLSSISTVDTLLLIKPCECIDELLSVLPGSRASGRQVEGGAVTVAPWRRRERLRAAAPGRARPGTLASCVVYRSFINCTTFNTMSAHQVSFDQL